MPTKIFKDDTLKFAVPFIIAVLKVGVCGTRAVSTENLSQQYYADASSVYSSRKFWLDDTKQQPGNVKFKARPIELYMYE